MRSLRSVLFFGTVLAAAAIVLALGGLFWLLVRRELLEQFDGALLDTARTIARAAEEKPSGVVFEANDIDLREFERPDNRSYLQVWGPDGRSIYLSASLTEGALQPIAGTLERPGLLSIHLPDGDDGRAIGFQFPPRVEDEEEKMAEAERRGQPWQGSSLRVSLVLARDTSARDEPIDHITLVLGGLSLLALAAAAGLLAWVIGWSVAPLDRLAAQISQLDAESPGPSSRVQLENAPLEVRPIVDRLNDFLGRLEASFVRERSLSADLAHELRTPLSGIRSTADVALSRLRDAEEYKNALSDCLSIAVGMQAMVENLLSLARLEAGLAEVEAVPVHVEDRLAEAWKLLSRSAEAKALRLQWKLGDSEPIWTDAALLDAVLRNVLENAVEYADAGGTVVIETLPAVGSVEVRVRNTGSQHTQQQAGHVFQRFWRGDTARTDAGAHCGVGLVYVQRIITTLGGSVEVRSEAGGWFEIFLRLPTRCRGPRKD